MQIQSVRISKATMDQAPEDERLTYLMAGSLANDINILSKLMLAANNTSTQLGGLYSYPANGSLLLISKLFAGRLFEAWKWLGSGSTRQVRIRWAMNKESDVWAAYKALNSYFNTKDNLVNLLRNKLGFHSDIEAMRQGYGHLEDDGGFCELIGDDTGNTFFATSEVAILGALCHLANEPDLEKALIQMLDGIIGVAGHFTAIASNIIAHFLTHVIDIGDTFDSDDVETEDIDTIRLPFFTHRTDK